MTFKASWGQCFDKSLGSSRTDLKLEHTSRTNSGGLDLEEALPSLEAMVLRRSVIHSFLTQRLSPAFGQ